MTGPRYKDQLGISLVELLVAMAIQFILLAGMVYVYGSSRTMFTVNQELSRVQENGRYASGTLLYDIRMAGFAGCRSLNEVAPNIVANTAPTFSAVTDGLNVFENGVGWTNPTAITRLAGTDVITVQSISGAGVPLSAAMASASANISVASNSDAIAATDLLLVYDCSRTDLIRASSVGTGTPVAIGHNNTTNSSNSLSKAYGTDALVIAFDARTYFIGTDASGEAGLYQHSFNSNTVSLLTQGVESMQLLLAEDTNGDQEPDLYVDASGVIDWEAVIGVRVGLLMSSADGTASDARAFTFDGANANAASDRRLRKAFWSYAALRNRI